MKAIHNLAESLKVGQDGEKLLDGYFEKFYEIEAIDPPGELWDRDTDRNHYAVWCQRRGIDRIFTNRRSGEKTSVEYKVDSRCHSTGNTFVEVHQFNANRDTGWAWSTCAQIVVYLDAVSLDALAFGMLDLRDHLPEWEAKYRGAMATSRGVFGREYSVRGVLVPWSVVESIARWTGNVSTSREASCHN